MTTLLLGAAAAAVTAGVLVALGWLKVRLFGYTFEPTGSRLPYLLYEGFIVDSLRFRHGCPSLRWPVMNPSKVWPVSPPPPLPPQRVDNKGGSLPSGRQGAGRKLSLRVP